MHEVLCSRGCTINDLILSLTAMVIHLPELPKKFDLKKHFLSIFQVIDIFEGNRKSLLAHGDFFLASLINSWKNQLKDNSMKMEIIKSLLSCMTSFVKVKE